MRFNSSVKFPFLGTLIYIFFAQFLMADQSVLDQKRSPNALISSSDYVADMDLGSGFDSLRGTIIAGNPCLEDFEIKDRVSREEVTFAITDIKDSGEMKEAMNIELEGTIGFSIFEFSIGGDIEVEEEFDNKNIYYLITLNYEKDDYSIKEPKLSEEATKLFANQDLYEEFRQKCGDQYIETVTTGSQMVALIEIHNKSAYERSKIEVNASTFIGKKVAGASLGVDISGSFLREVENISHDRKVTIKVIAQGIEDSVPFTISPEQLMNYIKGFIGELNSIGSTTYRESPLKVKFQDYESSTLVKRGGDILKAENAMREYGAYLFTYRSLLFDVGSIIQYPYDFVDAQDSVKMLTELQKELNIYISQIEYFKDKCQLKDPRKRSCLSIAEIKNRYGVEFKNEWELRDVLPPKMTYFPKDCRDIKELYGETDDGEYRVYLGGDKLKPFNIYCHNMGSSSPEEYLTLPNSSIDNSKQPTSNYIKDSYIDGKDLFENIVIYDKYRVSISMDSISIYTQQQEFLQTNRDINLSEETILLGFLSNRYSTESGQFNIDISGTGFIFDENMLGFRDTTFNSMIFEMVDTNMSWEEAEQFAESRDGRVVSIVDREYESKVIEFLKEKNITVGEFWTSGQRDSFGNFQWRGVEDSFFDYQNFNGGLDGGDCITFDTQTFKWGVDSCEKEKPFLISYDNSKSGFKNIALDSDLQRVDVEFSKPFSDLRLNHEIILRYRD